MTKKLSIACVSIFALILLASSSFAQSNFDVPDLTGKDWKIVNKTPMAELSNAIPGLVVNQNTYVNDSTKVVVRTLEFKGEDFLMAFGKDGDTLENVIWAIKANGKWHISSTKGYKDKVAMGANLDAEGVPNGVRFSLLTVDGLQEVLITK